jgi:D-sedoheptulose 7-phosphate isomerase|tara:strand:- start:194 stop:769 length:576 start_codon:yes stop_codon:yes gene_type:complete
MFSEALNKRKELHSEIGSSFDEIFKEAVIRVTESIQNEGTLFFAGNGGSAAESQHMSAEYIATLDHNKFRPGIKSIALTVDTSFMTAWTNDFGYEEVFKRQLETLSTKGDVFFAYSTSGNSMNILKALESAKEKEVITIGFSGNDGGKMKNICDTCFVVPHMNTALIQEVHSILGHEICSSVEKSLFFSDS